jgi:hypothetical protein
MANFKMALAYNFRLKLHELTEHGFILFLVGRNFSHIIQNATILTIMP